MVAPLRRPATFEDLLACDDPDRLEIIGGEIVEERILLVHRWSHDGYTVVQRAAACEAIRAEPFDAIERRVGVLFGDEDEEDE